jgi:membrane dipeptidase
VIFDAHCDTLVKTSSADSFLRGGDGCQIDLPGLVEARVGHLVTAVCVEPYPERMREVWNRGVENWNGLAPKVRELSLHFALEGCLPLHLGWVPPVRPLVASLTWNGDNPYASGIGGSGGLTDKGRALALSLHREGTGLDISHLNDSSRKDVLSMGVPVCATHCNARRLCDCPRNLPDPDIREIAATGGVIGITLVPDFITDPGAGADIAAVADHLEHVAGVGGVDSVGIGSDFDGVLDLPTGIGGVRDLPLVLEELRIRGWSTSDLEKVSSGNWMRFFGLDGGNQ